MRHLTRIACFLSFLFILNACEDPVEITDGFTEMEFTVAHKVDGETLVFDDIQYTNEAGNRYSVVRLQYFISNVVLHEEDGDSVLIDKEHYVDAAESLTFDFFQEDSIPNARYSRISFVFGLNAEKNTPGRFRNPPESNMEWPMAMGSGYHYMKLEGKYLSGTDTKNYNTHTGPSMNMPYFIEVDLPESGFIANSKKLTVKLEMNVNNWYENPNTYDFDFFGQAIMGNANAQKVLQENGKDVFSVTFATEE